MWCFKASLLILAAVPALGSAPPRGMFDLYAANRAEGRPNFITTDFALLGYSMALDGAMAETEEKVLLPEAIRIVEGLSQSGGAADFLHVVHALLKGEEPAEPATVVAELKRVRAAEGIARSELMLQNLDYSQFRPRGRYTRSPELQRYFQGMRYAGTVLFPVVASQSTGIKQEEADRLTAEAILMARALRGRTTLAVSYERLNRRLGILFGPAEDLTAGDFAAVSPTSSPAKARTILLASARANGHQPAILASPVDVSKLEPGVTASDALTGWRLFPLRYTQDGAALQQLVFDRVKRYQGTAHPESLALIAGQPVKGFPLANEVMALLGSREAIRRLDRGDNRNYEGYAEAFRKASTGMRAGTDLASRQLQLLGEWLRAGDGPDSPQRLESALGFWTWIRYNNLLYSKQSYTAVLKGIPLMKPRDRAWIEPSPLYGKLAAQLDLLRSILPGETLPAVAGLLRRCAEVSSIEKAGGQPSEAQVEFLNGLDLALLNLTGKPDRPIVVDVHTEPNSGLVLEEALAFPSTSTQTLAGGQTAFGARFTHREFKQSMSRRLNDDDWMNMLEAERMGKADTALRRGPLMGSSMPLIVRVAAQQAPGGEAEDFVSLDRLGKELIARGEWAQAVVAFERALSVASTDAQAAQAHARIGKALAELGREDEGMEHLEQSLEIHHYDQVEDELKEMRLKYFGRTRTQEEITRSLERQQMQKERGTRVRPLNLKVLFDFNQATLTPEGLRQVDELGASLASGPMREQVIQITGHTDLIGKPDYNQALSERRAESVAAEISRTFGLPRDHMRTKGKGMNEPLYQSVDPDESALNRRVEVLVIGR